MGAEFDCDVDGLRILEIVSALCVSLHCPVSGCRTNGISVDPDIAHWCFLEVDWIRAVASGK